MKSFYFGKRLYFFILIQLMLISTMQSQIQSSRIQNTEQFVRLVEQMHSPSRPNIQLNELNQPDGKCGLWLSFEAAQNWNLFSESQKKRLQLSMTPQQYDTNTIMGHFRIFYDTSGINEPALLDQNSNRISGTAHAFIDSVGTFFNYSWHYYVDILGYDPPPLQKDQLYYNIYVSEFYNNYYGMTNFDPITDQIGNYAPPRYTSFIEIDNDYKGFYSEGMKGLKVTSAHEFHHAIQLGSYGYWANERYFYEITSTWMEDVLFTEVNDYYAYVRTWDYINHKWSPRGQFATPYISFNSISGILPYSRAIWGKFIEKRYSPNIMEVAWKYIRDRHEHVLLAMDDALADSAGSSFRQAFLEWAVWNYNTGSSSDTIKYYTEGRQYPEMQFGSSVEYSNSPRSFTDSIEALSSCYHPVCLLNSPTDNCNTSQKMLVIVSNLNLNETSSTKFGFTYDLSNIGGTGYTPLSNGIYIRLNVTDPSNWFSQETASKIVPDVVVQPNPFMPKGTKPLIFRLPQPINQTEGSLNIYTSSMDQVLSKDISIKSLPFAPEIQWDGLDSQGRSIPSGIYIYVIWVDGKQFTGKFAVVRN